MTKSLEDYLEEIHVLILQKGRARVRDVALDLHVKMPSVVKAITELKKLELVGRHNLLKAFLVKLNVPAETADKDACLMEHILSATTLDRIREFVEAADNKAPSKKKETK